MFNRIVRAFHIVDKDQSKHGELDLPQWPAYISVTPKVIDIRDKEFNYHGFISHISAPLKVIKPDEYIKARYTLSSHFIYQHEGDNDPVDAPGFSIDIEYRLVTQNTKTWYLDINIITDKSISYNIESILNAEFMCQCPFNLYINGK
ncbi:hypothetical protein KEN51_CDS0196 [Pseudomonas phage vB_Pae10145-KEN51]|nr:hypothetical protein [Pseudomonas aeruginosa]QGK89861.1 hypothetical protein [Pseudomonas phage vB_PA32_GUMS]QOV08079.1 hypothetical protein [Pseudomonas phage vB_PaeM_kmuB]WNV49820.1 hypothetical protein [Pseudomonas phage ANB1]